MATSAPDPGYVAASDRFAVPKRQARVAVRAQAHCARAHLVAARWSALSSASSATSRVSSTSIQRIQINMAAPQGCCYTVRVITYSCGGYQREPPHRYYRCRTHAEEDEERCIIADHSRMVLNARQELSATPAGGATTILAGTDVADFARHTQLLYYIQRLTSSITAAEARLQQIVATECGRRNELVFVTSTHQCPGATTGCRGH